MTIPSGLVTLLFTDIEGSTRLWEDHPSVMAVALARHDHLLCTAIESGGGYVFKTVGDAFCAAFSDADSAVLAAVDAQRALTTEQWPDGIDLRVRMALYSGRCYERDGDFFGPVVNRAARLERVAHGGQIVCSSATAEMAKRGDARGLRFIDLGSHLLKDLVEPELVQQVTDEALRSEFPPLRSLTNPLLANNLPAQVTSLIGRVREIEQVRALLQSYRLVSLTGSGGVGKTRLALHVAAELVDGSGHGVWFVELASISDPELVPSEIAAAIGVQQEPDRPVLESLVETLEDQARLIVLDNCEHVIDAVAKTVDVLLHRCSRLVVMATSREPLEIQGETIFRVPSLSVPEVNVSDLEELLRCEAVQLLVDRAALQKPGFTLDDTNTSAVASICRRLDGIALAIELAAARLRSMSIQELERRLDDQFRLLTGGSRTALPRHRTLWALIDWSYRLLPGHERVVLDALSVFRGGFTIEAVEAVTGQLMGGMAAALDCLASLVDKNLVQVTEVLEHDRYYLLEAVRQFADEKLRYREEGAPRSVHQAHAEYYLEWAETNSPRLWGEEQAVFLDGFQVEHPNLRAAMSYLLDAGPAGDGALRLAVALKRYWSNRGHWVEGVAETTAALEGCSNQRLSSGRVAALVALAELKARQGDYRSVLELETEALHGARQLGLPAMVADALRGLSHAQRMLRDLDSATITGVEAVEAARELGDQQALAQALVNLGGCCDAVGDIAGARSVEREALEIFHRLNDRRGIVAAGSNLAYYEQRDGNLEAAREQLNTVLAEATVLGEITAITTAALNLGFLGLSENRVVESRQRFVEVLAEAERADARMERAYALLGLAMCTSAAGLLDAASQLHGAACRQFEDLSSTPDPHEASMRDEDHARLKAELGVEAFEAGLEAGRALTKAEISELVHQVGASP